MERRREYGVSRPGRGRPPETQVRAARVRRTLARLLGPCLACALAFPGTARGEEAGTHEVGLWLGLAWHQPAGPVADVYGGGPGLSAALSLDDGSRIAGALRVEIFRDRTEPDHPDLVREVASRFLLVPVSLELLYRAADGPRRPFLVGGASIWFADESFDYSLLGRSYEAGAGGASLGAVLGIGYELSDIHHGLRASLRWSASRIGREVVRPSGVEITTGADDIHSLWSLSLEAGL